MPQQDKYRRYYPLGYGTRLEVPRDRQQQPKLYGCGWFTTVTRIDAANELRFCRRRGPAHS